MKKIWKLYQRNSIIQFLISYILVLVVPFLVLSYGFQRSFNIVEEEIKDSHVKMLQHSVNIIDNDLERLESMALQIAQNSAIQSMGRSQKNDKGYIITAIDAVDEFYNITHYQSIDLLDEGYLYFQGVDLVLYSRTYYRPEIFQRYLQNWGTSLDTWRKNVVAPEIRVPGYEKLGNTIEYRMPFSEYLVGDNEGVLVYRLKEAGLKELLDFGNVYAGEEYAILVFDQNRNLLWSEGSQQEPLLIEKAFDSHGYFENEGQSVIRVTSGKNKWDYVLVVPEKTALLRLGALKNLVFFLGGSAIVIGILVSVMMAVKKGKPINEVWGVLSSAGKNTDSYQKMGEVVTGILQDHQNLLSELEMDKISRKKEFFHDLLKAGFDSENQLRISAQKAEISMVNTEYVVASFEIFSNNDFNDIDSQTLDELRIIIRLIRNRLEELYQDRVWFYKKNYRDTIVIFAIENNYEEIKKTIAEIHDWLVAEYQVNTSWGIGKVCDDLLYLWKSGEEARHALRHADFQVPVVEYDLKLVSDNEFYFPDIAQEKLEVSLRAGHLEEVRELLGILKKENFEKRKVRRSLFIKFNRKITELLSKFLRQDSSGKDLILWLNEIVINPEESYEGYFNRLDQICQRICKETGEKKKQQRGIMIDSVIAYMNENYMDSGLGLAQVGTVFRVSEGYLSSVFKEQAGINFADYLEKVRIDKGSELLKDGSLTVNDIAAMVGYNSVQSFRRAFKRVKGISPKEARS